MENIHVWAAVLLAVCLFAIGYTFVNARRQAGVSRSHFSTIGAVLCLLALLGLVPRVREVILSAHFPETDLSDATLGTLLVSAVVVLGIALGLVLTGRKRLAVIAHDTVERLRVALDERRYPQLRKRNVCIRKYERVLRVLQADDPSKNFEGRMWRHDEMVSSVIRNLTDEEIPVLSEFLCLLMLEGKSPADVFVFFLKGERRCASRDEYGMRDHLVRLRVLAARIQQEHAAA